MGMTVVHAELEMKRLKKLEEIKSKYFSTRLSAMLFIQVIESQSAATAFKLIQIMSFSFNSATNGPDVGRGSIERASETEKEGRERQTNETQEFLKRQRELEYGR